MARTVGRRAGGLVKSEKFSIPPARKTEILKNMRMAGFVTEHESIPEAVKNPPEDIKTERIRAAEPPPIRTDLQGKEQPEPVASKAPLQEEQIPARSEDESTQDASQDFDFLEQVEKFRALQKNKGAAPLRGAGLAFLKAAQWALSGKYLMEGLIKKCLKGSLSGHFNVASDMYLFFQFLGVKTVEDILSYQDHGIWPLNDCRPGSLEENNELLELKQLFRGDSALPDAAIRTLIMEYGIEKENALLEVKGYKLYLEDASELVFDAQMVSFSGGSLEAAWGRQCVPVNRALTILSDCLIANIRNCVFRRIPGEEKFGRPFYDMVDVFENLPGKRIVKATMLTKDDEEFTEFSAIPSQKRIFLAGVGPRQGEFKDLTKSVKWAAKRPYYHEETDRVYYFAETKSGLGESQFRGHQNELRVVTIWKQKDKDPLGAIVTNHVEETGKTILEKYISSWPYFDTETQEVSRLIDDPVQQPKPSWRINNFSDIFLDFAQCLHYYSCNHFFPQNIASTDINEYISNIYNISGRIHKIDDAILVTLEMASAHKYRDSFEYAVRRVNESHIFDHSGRRLWMSIACSPE